MLDSFRRHTEDAEIGLSIVQMLAHEMTTASEEKALYPRLSLAALGQQIGWVVSHLRDDNQLLITSISEKCS